MKKIFKLLYIIIFISICTAPAGVYAYNYYENNQEQMNIEKTLVKTFPYIYENGHINTNFDDECEDWLNQNIPYRALILTKINYVLSEILKQPTSNVIMGEDGWIYSKETIDDYMDTNAMSQKNIQSMTVTLSLIQENVESRGGRFLFAPVPNKNSIYSEYMPYRFIHAKENNLTRIYKSLGQAGVNYADLRKGLLDEKDSNNQARLYYKRDTHWNCLGALAGYRSLINALGVEGVKIDTSNYSVEALHRGDLEQLLYPMGNNLEEEYCFDTKLDYDSFEFIYPEGITDTKAQLENYMSDKEDHDNNFTTRKKEMKKANSLYMIRDSFARALLPYMIQTYDEATFVRTATPSIESIADNRDVIYEICERNLKNVIESAPFMYAPIREALNTDLKPINGETNKCFYKDEGYAFRLYGYVDSNMVGEDGRIYIACDDGKSVNVFEAFPIYEKALLGENGLVEEANLQGFSLYIDKRKLESNEFSVKIISGNYITETLANIEQSNCGADNVKEDVNEAAETMNPYPEENARHQLLYRGVSIGIGDNINALEAGLGNQAAPSETVYSCLSGEEAVLYYYPNITIEADMEGNIYYISLMDNSYADGKADAVTASGITLGSDKLDIWDKLGSPSKENDRNCIFGMEHLAVTYTFKGGVVTAVILEDCQYKKESVDTDYSDANEPAGVEYEGGNTYLYDEKHTIKTGWQIVNEEYYFFDRMTGERITGQVVDGINIAADGEVNLSDYEKQKIETMMKAHKIVEEVTSPSDSMEEKRKKVFEWVLSFPYHRYRHIRDVYEEEGIEIIEANDIFDEGAGDCVSEAAAVAFLFHEIGYNNVYWVHDTGHSWVRCEDRLYDPLFAESRGFDANYDAPFTDYRASMAHSMLIY